MERRLKHWFHPEFRGRMHPASPSALFSPIFSRAREKIGPSETTGSCKSATTSQSRLRRASSPGRGAKGRAPPEVQQRRGGQPLSQPAADSSPERGAFPLRRVHPSGAPRQLPLTRGALGAYKTRKSPRKKVQTSKSGLHLLLTANMQPQLLTNSVSCIRRRVVKNS